MAERKGNKSKHIKHGIFINGLQACLTRGEVVSCVCHLISLLNVPIRKSHVKVLLRNNKSVALVNLFNKETTDYVLSLLSSQDSRNQINFNFSAIANHGFYISRIREENEEHSKLQYDKSNNGLSSHDTQPSDQSIHSRSSNLCSAVVHGTFSTQNNGLSSHDIQPSDQSIHLRSSNLSSAVVPGASTQNNGLSSHDIQPSDQSVHSRSSNLSSAVNHGASTQNNGLSSHDTQPLDQSIHSRSSNLSSAVVHGASSAQNNTVDACTSARSMPLTPRQICVDQDTSVQSLFKPTVDAGTGTLTHGMMNSVGTGMSSQNISIAKQPSNKHLFSTQGKALDAATSISGLSPNFHNKFYHFHEKLGAETRNIEFKEGKGNYRKDILKEHVGKYVCGFMNSQEGGTLYIGVHDSGMVQGIECDQKEEDQLRLKIDETIKMIEPSIMTQMYTVSFIPVLKHGTFSENLKVIEICVHRVETDEDLYEYKGSVFVRRDGSIQKLKIKDIKDWTKKKAANDVAQTNSVKQQLDEVSSQLQQIQSQLQQKPAKKSHICNIL